MTNLFGSLVDHAVYVLEAVGFQRRKVASPYDFRESQSGVIVNSSWYVHAKGTEMKCAYITSSRAEILNMMIYPLNAEVIPVFAIDYIAMAQKPYVAVADLQPAMGQGSLSSEVIEALKPFAGKLSVLLSPGGELPEWSRSYFTPTCIYSRPKSISENEHLVTAFKIYLDVWIKGFHCREDGRQAGAEALRTYQEHHVKNTPGTPFLSKVFGQEWAEDYHSKFMYSQLTLYP